MTKKGKSFMIFMAVLMVFLSVRPAAAAESTNRMVAVVVDKKLFPKEFTKAKLKKRLSRKITKQEMIYVLLYAIKADVSKEKAQSFPFADKSLVKKTYRPYLSAAWRLKILKGTRTEKGVLSNGRQNVTKREASVLLGRAFQFKEDEKNGSYSSGSEKYLNAVGQARIVEGDVTKKSWQSAAFTWEDMVTAIYRLDESGRLSEPDIKILAQNQSMIDQRKGSVESQVFNPMGIDVDEKGSLYFADNGNNLIGIIENGRLKDFSGVRGPRDLYNKAIGGYADKDIKNAVYNRPSDVLVSGKGILIADSANNAIRQIKDKEVFTYAGSPEAGYKDGDRKTALFRSPSGLAEDENGNIYVADTGNHVIRRIDINGVVTTIAGQGGKAGYSNGNAKNALLCEPAGLAYYKGALYIADSGNQRIRKWKDGKLSTVAGGGNEKYENTIYYAGEYKDGKASEARFNNPRDLAFGEDGSLYITDMDNGLIRKWKDGYVSTLLGFSMPVTYKGTPADTFMAEPCGIVVKGRTIVVTDSFTNTIFSLAIEE